MESRLYPPPPTPHPTLCRLTLIKYLLVPPPHPTPCRLRLMKYLLACLEVAVQDSEDSQAVLLQEGGLQLLLSMVLLNATPKQEVGAAVFIWVVRIT